VLVQVFGSGRVGLKVNPTGGYNDVGYVLSLQAVINANLNILMLLRVSQDATPGCSQYIYIFHQ
jgi:hypothetical protein